jgi:hypothetical protein
MLQYVLIGFGLLRNLPTLPGLVAPHRSAHGWDIELSGILEMIFLEILCLEFLF